MTVINGRDVLIAIDDVPIFCGKDCSLEIDQEIIPASTVTSGVWKEFRLRKRSWLMNVAGLTKIDNTDGQLSYFDVINDAAAMAIQNLSMTFTDPDSNVVMVSGTGYFDKSSIEGSVNQFAQASVSIIGDGDYTIT